jgi:predicted GH43/DUF377 family glycosyl hydrolase
LKDAPMRMDGFVLGPGPAGRCDDLRVGGAVVDHDIAGGLWRMWYYCRDRAFNPDAPPTLGSGRIALATSPDGVDWTRFDGPLTGGAVMEPSPDPADFDSVHIGLTDVSRGAGEWLMWYFGGDAAACDSGSHLGVVRGLGLRPGLARSDDGVHWRRAPGDAQGGALIDIDEGDVYAAWPNMVEDRGRWIMQYTAPAYGLKDYRTRAAVSTDGRRWTKLGVMLWADGARPWDCTGVITRQVLPNPLEDGARWLMIYTGTDKDHRRSIAAAQSDDGLTWRHYGEGPIFGVGEADAWDSLGVAATRLVPAEGRLYLYYYGFQSLGDDGKPRGIGLAISETGDLGGFRRIVR